VRAPVQQRDVQWGKRLKVKEKGERTAECPAELLGRGMQIKGKEARRK